MDKEIKGFFKEYRFLSNYHIKKFKYNGKLYLSSEHAYQAAKAITKKDHELIRKLKTPSEAKKRGNLIKTTDGFFNNKIKIMEEILIEKFKDQELKELLANTDNAYLEETNYWHDNFWGNCTCDDCQHIGGRNHLGEILMRIRSKIK